MSMKTNFKFTTMKTTVTYFVTWFGHIACLRNNLAKFIFLSLSDLNWEISF